MKIAYDVAVIGSGPGGYACALRASQLGLKTVCIEEADELGGACLHIGCIPSKTLYAASEVYKRFVDEAAKKGHPLPQPLADTPSVRAKKPRIGGELAGAIRGLFRANGVDVIHARAHLVDKNTIRAIAKSEDVHEVHAKSIVLATGSYPIELPFLPFDEYSVLSSTAALSLDVVPKKLVVIGAGAVGVAFASMYAALGSEVVVVDAMPSLCTGVDATMADALFAALKNQKITFFFNAHVINAQRKNGNGAVLLRLMLSNGVEEVLEAEKVLVAIGRHPRSNDLGLLEINIDMTHEGAILVDDQFRTSQPNVYAIGDLIHGPKQAYRATLEGIAAAEIIAGKSAFVDYMTIPSVIYSNPELASIGMTEEQARESGNAYKVGVCEFHEMPQAARTGEFEAAVKVIADAKTDKLIGMHILSSQASDMITLASLAIAKNTTLTELGNLPFAHPAYSEAIKEACLRAKKGP